MRFFFALHFQVSNELSFFRMDFGYVSIDEMTIMCYNRIKFARRQTKYVEIRRKNIISNMRQISIIGTSIKLN